MKHLGKIEIGGSLDITNNKHVEDLIEETLKGIDIPEDTNTTYTLTQDGLVVQLVDDRGQTVSEIEIPKLEDKNTTYTLTQDGTTIRLEGSEGGSSEIDLAPLIPQPTDPYQEEKDLIIRSEEAVNLFDTIRSGGYDDFDITSEFDAENSLISIYLHLHIGENVETFTLADNVGSMYNYYSETQDILDTIDLREIYTINRYGEEILHIDWVDEKKRERDLEFWFPQIELTVESPLYGSGLVLFSEWNIPIYFIFPDVNEETESGQQVITGTLEEHLQNIYGHIYNS